MSMLPLGPQEWVQLTEQVRSHNTARIKDVLASLEPYVDGSVGPINPAHVRAYLEALRALGQLWRVFDKPEVLETEKTESSELMAAEARQAVLAELTKLRELRGPGSAGPDVRT